MNKDKYDYRCSSFVSLFRKLKVLKNNFIQKTIRNLKQIKNPEEEKSKRNYKKIENKLIFLKCLGSPELRLACYIFLRFEFKIDPVVKSEFFKEKLNIEDLQKLDEEIIEETKNNKNEFQDYEGSVIKKSLKYFGIVKNKNPKIYQEEQKKIHDWVNKINQILDKSKEKRKKKKEKYKMKMANGGKNQQDIEQENSLNKNLKDFNQKSQINSKKITKFSKKIKEKPQNKPQKINNYGNKTGENSGDIMDTKGLHPSYLAKREKVLKQKGVKLISNVVEDL